MTNTTAKKPTKRDYFNALLTKYPLTEDEKAFVKHELELLDRKNSAEKKPTALQIANQTLSAQILDFMELNVPYSITDIMKQCSPCNGLSNPKITALMRPLLLENGGSVERVSEKRKTVFIRRK